MRSLLQTIRVIGVLSVWLTSFINISAYASPRHVVCVENVWCSIAQDIGGESVTTHALIATEGLDPHHIQPTPSMARQLTQADAVIINGATYDDWALPLSSSAPMRIIAQKYEPHWQNGDDPHLFFNPDTVKNVADTFAAWLITQEPQQKDAITERQRQFHARYEHIMQLLNSLHDRFHGQAVAVTEPAGERLLLRAGLNIINHRWALSMMNEDGASPRDTAALEDALAHKKVRFLLVNPTVSSPQINSLISLAQAHTIPTISAGESLPQGVSWSDWIMSILSSIDHTLSHPSP